MCCTRLAENTGRKNGQKFAIWAPSYNFVGLFATKARIDNRKKIVKQQCLYLLHMSSHVKHGELRPTNGWGRFGSLGHPCKFQRVSHLGSVTARLSSGRQPDFAALNRGHHLYSAGRPSRWALAHISSCWYFPKSLHLKYPEKTLKFAF